MLCMVIVTWCLTDRTWPEPFLSKHTNSSCRIRKFSYLASPSRFRVSLVSMLGPFGSLIATSYHHVYCFHTMSCLCLTKSQVTIWKSPPARIGWKAGNFCFYNNTEKDLCWQKDNLWLLEKLQDFKVLISNDLKFPRLEVDRTIFFVVVESSSFSLTKQTTANDKD